MKLSLILLSLFLISFSSCQKQEEIKEKNNKNNDFIELSDTGSNLDEVFTNIPADLNLKQENPIKEEPCLDFELDKKDVCLKDFYTNKALVEKDFKVCENIKNEKFKILCKDEFVLSEALELLDEKLCQNILSEDLKNNCLKNIQDKKILMTGDVKSCKNFSNESDIKDCEESFALRRSLKFESTEGCDSLEGESKDKCISETLINLAIEKMNKQFCEEIPTKSEKETCNNILKAILGE